MPIDSAARALLHRALLIASVAVFALTVVACGGSDSTGDASAPTSASTSATQEPTEDSDQSGEQGEDPTPEEDASASPDLTDEESKPPAAGELGSPECALDRKRLEFVVRDWGRLYGSIGRPDHTQYTGAFAAELKKVSAAGTNCAGAASLKRFVRVVNGLHRSAEAGSPDYPRYDVAVQVGNKWMESLGYGAGSLTTG